MTTMAGENADVDTDGGARPATVTFDELVQAWAGVLDATDKLRPMLQTFCDERSIHVERQPRDMSITELVKTVDFFIHVRRK